MTDATSRYAPDLTKATAGIPQLIGDFEFKVNDVKTFKRTTTDPATQENKDVYGIQYALQVTEADEDNQKLLGKTIPLQLYMHVETTEGLNKRFIMAALGFPMNEEDDFNTKYAGADWNYNPDEGTIPENAIWKQVVGTRIRATCTIKPDKKDPSRKNQQFDWKPF
jgi:hypothetical protein